MKHLLRTAAAAALSIVFLWPVRPALAEDRALLIGVGKYVKESANLPGIDLDINIMKDVAQLMGFKKEQIRVLMDSEATLANTRQAMENWLIQGVTENDHVLIYYSGHGSRIPDANGDEEDGLDEVLTMHEAKPVVVDRKQSLTGVLVDDEFNAILEKIKSKSVLVLVDACHSGTATKSLKFRDLRNGESEAMIKFFFYPGLQEAVDKGFAVESGKSESNTNNFVSISAASDTEESLASDSGSYFTLGVKKAIDEANRSGEKLTPQDVLNRSSSFISDQVNAGQLFHPQLSGNQQLANRPLRMTRVENGHGPKWQRIADMVGKMGTLQVHSEKTSFRNGEALNLSVEVPRDGYLNVIVIDSKDEPIVLFPNSYHRDNRVQAGRLDLPGNLNFSIQAGEPFGPNLVVALHSTRPVNMFEEGSGKRDSKGFMQDFFPSLSEKSLTQYEKALERGFSVKEKETGKEQDLGGKLELRVNP